MTTGFDGNRALLSGELDWKQFLKPKDLLDLEDCRRIDQFNEGLYEYNNSMLPRINELREKMGETKFRLDAPPKYAHMAQRKIREKMWTPEYRMLGATKFMAARKKYAGRDYELNDGPALADALAEEEEIRRLVARGPIDITDTVGKAHVKNCTCELKWDGKSERCFGTGARLRWKRHAEHHFEAPRVVPETY